MLRPRRVRALAVGFGALSVSTAAITVAFVPPRSILTTVALGGLLAPPLVLGVVAALLAVLASNATDGPLGRLTIAGAAACAFGTLAMLGYSASGLVWSLGLATAWTAAVHHHALVQFLPVVAWVGTGVGVMGVVGGLVWTAAAGPGPDDARSSRGAAAVDAGADRTTWLMAALCALVGVAGPATYWAVVLLAAASGAANSVVGGLFGVLFVLAGTLALVSAVLLSAVARRGHTARWSRRLLLAGGACATLGSLAAIPMAFVIQTAAHVNGPLGAALAILALGLPSLAAGLLLAGSGWHLAGSTAGPSAASQ